MPAVFVFFLLSACEGPVEKQAVRQQEAARALLDSALEHSTRGESTEAILLLRRAVQLDPRDPVIHYDLGNSLARQGRLDQAAGVVPTSNIPQARVRGSPLQPGLRALRSGTARGGGRADGASDRSR